MNGAGDAGAVGGKQKAGFAVRTIQVVEVAGAFLLLLALGGLPAAINPGIFLGAKTIAATLLDLLTEPSLLQQAQDEFRERTGGGIGGTKWVEPLLPKDFPPPTDLRWPEYVQTARGEEWWIPTPAIGSGAGDPL